MKYKSYFKQASKAAGWLQKKTDFAPEIVVVLTGGMDDFVGELENSITLSSDDIPGFPKISVEGHAGKIHFGTYSNKKLVVLQGRFHYYEGHSPQEVVFPYFVFNEMGADIVLSTNAVGGIRDDLKPGDIMMITDHINMMGMNPLIGIATQREQDQFTSMIDAYDPALCELARTVASNLKIELKEGVFVAVSGPSYETRAEILAFQKLGADAVGMSTVPSVIAARFLGMRVLSFCGIANEAAHIHKGEMKHSEVLNAMNIMSPKMVKLLQGIVAGL